MLTRHSLLLSLLTFSCLAEAIPQANSTQCGLSPSPYRVSARHIEGRGVGYTQGYTSVDLFIAPPPTLVKEWVPFIDARFHIFNNGQVATNAGLGLRYLSDSYVYGINSYYDYRETHHQKYNQYSLGLEALGKVWDFRLNGYLPLGSKASPFYNTSFSHFAGNSVFVSQRQEFAMKGLNAEAGIHIKKMDSMSFYGAFGPYYFEKKGQNAIGGRARLSGTFFDYLKLEISGSYDPIFHGIIQGEASLILPFGPRKKVTARQGLACSRELRLRERAIQTVDRNEILVLSHKNTTTPGINPLTGLPYQFIFVDNLSHSSGTYESPYHTLKDAETSSITHDVIYVFPGDGTTTGMDQGIILKDNQKLLGSSVATPLSTSQGDIIIPAFSSIMPNITYILDPSTTAYVSVIQLANACEVAGIHVTSTDTTAYLFTGILGGVADPTFSSLVAGVTDTNLHDNWIQGTCNYGGIRLHNCQGLLTIKNNLIDSIESLISQRGTGLGIKTARSSGQNIQAIISGNIISNTQWNGVFIGAKGNIVSLEVSNNIIEQALGGGVSLVVQANTFNSIISNNSISDTLLPISFYGTNVETMNAVLVNNIINTSSYPGIEFVPIVNGDLQLNISNNVISGTSAGITFTDASASNIDSIISNNTITNITYQGINFIPIVTGTVRSSISNNTISNVLLGITFDGMEADILYSNILNNTVTNTPANGIEFTPVVATSTHSTISGNVVSNTSDIDGIFLQIYSPTSCSSIIGNLLDTTGGMTIYQTVGVANMTLQNNILLHTADDPALNLTTTGGTICANLSGNIADLGIAADSGVSIEVGSQAVSGDPSFVPANACSCH